MITSVWGISVWQQGMHKQDAQPRTSSTSPNTQWRLFKCGVAATVMKNCDTRGASAGVAFQQAEHEPHESKAFRWRSS